MEPFANFKNLGEGSICQPLVFHRIKATHLNIEIIFNNIINTNSLTTMFTLPCLLKPSGRVHSALVSHDMHA